MKVVFFREEKPFHLFKSLRYKNGKMQNMQVVAGRLVFILDLIDMNLSFQIYQLPPGVYEM